MTQFYENDESDPTGVEKIFPDHDWDSAESQAFSEDFDAFEDLKEQLYRTRVAKEISLDEVASKMETTVDAVSAMEKIGSLPTVDEVQRYARAIGMKLVLQAKPAKPAARRKSA